jgi:NAD(P)-dependent dehydrogenase (short-subunit alcohol dehydrogenase family)
VTHARPSLAGKVAVVTGAALGIGRVTAEALAECGAVVAMVDRDASALAQASAAFTQSGWRHVAVGADVASEAHVNAAFDQVMHDAGRIDILVNNAGIAIRRSAVELPLVDWQAVVNVNLTGAFLCARAAARHMMARGGGAIVNVSSIMGLSGGGLYPNVSYQATKGALVNLTRALAVEWAPHSIRVNAVAPAWVKTDLTRGLFEDPALADRMLGMIPMRKLPEASDVAAAILFLASSDAAMITGHTLPVDGGFLAQ